MTQFGRVAVSDATVARDRPLRLLCGHGSSDPCGRQDALVEGRAGESTSLYTGRRPGRARFAGAPQLAAESGPSGSWTGAQPASEPSATTEEGRQAAAAPLEELRAAVDRVTRIDLDQMDDAAIRGLLQGIQRQFDRLAAVRATAAGTLETRAIRAAGPGREHEATRESRRSLRDGLRLPPSDVKRAAQTGRRLGGARPTAERFAAGDLGEAHAAVITDTLHQLHGPDRERLEHELIDAAGRLDPVGLGRLARRRLAQIDAQAGEQQERRRQHRRRFSMSAAADGSVRFSGELYGAQAEKAMTALHAFRRPDVPRESRTPEQRGADAFEALIDVALRAGEAPTRHGERPHVTVLITWSELTAAAGVPEFAYTGPASMSQVRPLLDDCTVSRVVLGPDGVPIEVGAKVRTVPAGLWRALVARDRTCTWDGCDAPAGWCQVAHGQVPFRLGGRLSLSNAALLCSRHHRWFDGGGWRMVIDGDDVTYQRDGGGGSGPGGSLAAVSGPPGGSGQCRGAEPPDDGPAPQPSLLEREGDDRGRPAMPPARPPP